MNTQFSQFDINKNLLAVFSSPLDFDRYPDRATQEANARIEEAWIDQEVALAQQYGLPSSTDEFGKWYSTLCKIGKDESRFLFEYLANSCSSNEMAAYICTEGEVDGRFDDIVAISQIGLSPKPKMTIANNYWDEMGNGDLGQMHTTLFNDSAEYFKNILRASKLENMISPSEIALKNGNILMALANTRRHSAKLIGALTILEHTAPYRFNSTVKGMKRLDVPEDVIYYHKMHIEIDAKHGKELLNDVILPLIAEGGQKVMNELCLGLIIRKNISFEYYKELDNLMHKIKSLLSKQ